MVCDDTICNTTIGGLHYDTRDSDFRGYFEKFGKVQSAEVMFNRETHKSRGFGFIIFEQENSVDAVCDVREHVIDTKVVEVKRAIPRSRFPGQANTSPSATPVNPNSKVNAPMNTKTSSGPKANRNGVNAPVVHKTAAKATVVRVYVLSIYLVSSILFHLSYLSYVSTMFSFIK